MVPVQITNLSYKDAKAAAEKAKKHVHSSSEVICGQIARG